MKKIFISGGEKLSKDAMKQIVGANSSKAPSSPKGSSASTNSALENNECYGSMCCWDYASTICSDCENNLSIYEAYCPDAESHLAPCNCY